MTNDRCCQDSLWFTSQFEKKFLLNTAKHNALSCKFLKRFEKEIFYNEPSLQHKKLNLCPNCPWKKLKIVNHFFGPFSATFWQNWATATKIPRSKYIFFAAPLDLFCRIFGHLAIVQTILWFYDLPASHPRPTLCVFSYPLIQTIHSTAARSKIWLKFCNGLQFMIIYVKNALKGQFPVKY